MGLALSVGCHRGDDGDVAGIQQGEENRRVHRSHIPHQAIGPIAIGASPHQRAIATGEAHGPGAQTIQAVDDLLVDPAHEDHFHHIHGVRAGHPQAIAELRLDVQAPQPLVDLGPAAVHDHRLHADRSKQHQVAIDRIAQVFANHGRTAVFHDDAAAGKTLDVGEGFTQHRHPQGVSAISRTFAQGRDLSREEGPRCAQV